MTLEELKKKVVTITVHKNIVLGEDLQEEWLKKYIEEVIYEEKDENGQVIKQVFGVSRILDPMLLCVVDKFF